ncbi:TonB-dependent receptor [Dyadobacter crusticola]|uniref:TonB-dependent receptor n=1 Tax=Dyadobacter crusticola TaxID=292407 RepID=UPI0004E274F0|nr:TonB-dependent receptor [Dyadobacter crusticola]
MLHNFYKLKKGLFALVAFIILAANTNSYSQTNQAILSGKLTDEYGQPIAGAHVLSKDGLHSAVTDSAGSYRLILPAGKSRVIFSHVGYGIVEKSFSVSDAQTTNGSIQLDIANQLNDITVTGSAMPAELRTISSSISILKASDPEMRQLQTIDDALNFIPGLSVGRNRGLTTTGTHTSITMRGTGASNRTLILKDGVPINDAYTGGVSEWNSTATGSIARIEVVRGPGSSIYGSNSMGGTINLVTETPTEKPTFGVDMRYGSMNTLQTGIKAGKRFKNGIGVIAFAEYKKTDGYQYMADSLWKDYFQKPKMELLNVNAKLSYQINPNSKLEAIMDYHLQKPVSGTTTIFDDKSSTNNYLLRYTGNNNLFNYSATAYYNHAVRNSESMKWNSKENLFNTPNYTSYVPINIYGFIGKINKNFKGNSVTVGADIRLTRSVSEKLYPEQGSQNFSGNQNFTSFFINDDISIGSKINVNVGARYDNWQNVKGKFFDNMTGKEISIDYAKASANVVSPKIGLVYRATDQVRFRSQYAMGFKAPNIFYLYNSAPLGSSFRLGNPNLKPERMVYSVDLGADFNINENLELSATYYTSQYKDFNESVLIPASEVPSYFDPAGLPVRQYINIGKVKLSGLETSLRYKLQQHFTLIGSYFYNRSKILQYQTNPAYEGKEMDSNPRHTLSGGLIYDNPKMINIGLWARHTSESFGDLENSENLILKPITVFDLKVSRQIGKFAVNANILNLFDKLYFGSYTSKTSYYYAPGRSVNIGLSYSLK